MSAARVALLGAIAGFTIFLGLPVGRIRNPLPRTKALINGTAIGILVFLLWDVLAQAWEPIDGAIVEKHYAVALGNGAVMVAALGAGLLGLVYYDRWMARRTRSQVSIGASIGPGAAAASELPGRGLLASPARQLSFYIAVGIGLHNFAEGLAIGQSAASGETTLAVLLVIGFGLHNATEGFGIVAPLAVEAVHPSWGMLGLLGLIGGGPTFVGTLIGQSFVNSTVSVAFLALAAGSILYVVVELLAVGRRMGRKELFTWGLLFGLFLGFATDAVVTAAGV